MTPCTKPLSQRGFTLIEMLVALALMALLSAMAYSGVSAMVSARTIVQKSTQKTLSMQAAFTQWSQDWSSAAGLRMRPGVQFTGNAIRMVRLGSNELGQVVAWRTTPSGLERLAWAPSSQPQTLARQWDATWQWIELSTSPKTFAQNGETASVESWPMLHRMQLFYYMENAWTNPYNTDTSDGWPEAVRLEVASPNGAVTLDWKNVNTTSAGRP